MPSTKPWACLSKKIETETQRTHVMKAVLALLLHTAEMLKVRQNGGDGVEFSLEKSF